MVEVDGFQAFLSYASGVGPAPPPPEIFEDKNDDDDDARIPPLDVEVAAFVGGDTIATDESSDDSLVKVKDNSRGAPARTGATSSVNDAATSYDPRVKYPPSFFTNDRGNLKAVALVVRHPCLIFWLILLFCFALTAGLQFLVFRTAENGVPFTPPTNEFNINDKRSVQYDSYRLARDDVQAMRKANELGDKVTPRQSETAGIAMWCVNI